MPSSPSSSVVAARKTLAGRLRELRREAGLTGRDLAARAGWHPSKASRLENAVTPPADEDIRTWCRICEAEDQTDDLLAASRSVESMYVEWRRLQRTGLRQLQGALVPLYKRTRQFRIYSSNIIPGFFQTPAYATALFSEITDFRGIPNDVPEAVAARMERSRVLYEGDHRFAFVLEEAVLRYRLGSPETMAGQLGHLLANMSLPAVSIGIIPFTAPRHLWPIERFSIFDSKQVQVELLSAEVTITAPLEVALHVKAFARLAEMAVHGAEARALITAAIDDLG